MKKLFLLSLLIFASCSKQPYDDQWDGQGFDRADEFFEWWHKHPNGYVNATTLIISQDSTLTRKGIK